jgi:hypothetical protein
LEGSGTNWGGRGFLSIVALLFKPTALLFLGDRGVTEKLLTEKPSSAMDTQDRVVGYREDVR